MIRPAAQGPAFQEIFCIAGDRHGNTFVGTNGHGISMIAPDGSLLSPSGTLRTLIDALAAASVSFVHEDGAGKYWIGTNDRGLMSWVPGQRQPVTHTSTTENPDGISSTQVTAVWEDDSGALWFGTSGDGVRSSGGIR